MLVMVIRETLRRWVQASESGGQWEDEVRGEQEHGYADKARYDISICLHFHLNGCERANRPLGCTEERERGATCMRRDECRRRESFLAVGYRASTLHDCLLVSCSLPPSTSAIEYPCLLACRQCCGIGWLDRAGRGRAAWDCSEWHG